MKVEVTRTLKRVVKLKYEGGVLKVLANCFLSNKRLKQIIDDNIDWIRQQKAESALKPTEPAMTPHAQQMPDQNIDYVDESVNGCYRELFEGRKTVLHGEVVKVVHGSVKKSYQDGNVLYLAENCSDTREGRLKAIKAFLKKTALLYVSKEIADFGSEVSLCPSKIEFKVTNDFWVMCSQASQRILCFDYRIVQLPKELRRYVIAHAFAHFKSPLHDDVFWNFIADILPRYKEYAKELEQYRILKEI